MPGGSAGAVTVLRLRGIVTGNGRSLAIGHLPKLVGELSGVRLRHTLKKC
jgi:hypothetical protein